MRTSSNMYLPVQKKMSQFLVYRDLFLDEMLCHEGFRDSAESTLCSKCREADGIIKCSNCFTQLLCCCKCIIAEHANLPLHWIKMCSFFLFWANEPNWNHSQEWNGQFFDKTILQRLGLQFQLGHSGARCPLPLRGPPNFTIVNTSGIHSVSIDFCDCSQGNSILH